MNRIYSGSAATIYHRPLFRIQSHVRHWIVEPEASRKSSILIISLLPYESWRFDVRYGIFFEKKKEEEEESETLSLFVSFLNIRESRGVEGCLINDWPDSASDTLRPPPSAPDFVDHLDEIYAARNSEASNTCLRHFAAACSLPCFERGTS